jgi:hypothetical protein
MTNWIQLTLLAMALAIVPLAYVALCVRMFRSRVWWFTYLAYFFLFGVFGGWCLAFAESPSGITASSIVFLVSAAVVACLASALVLQSRKKRDRFEKFAMIGGYVYPVLVVAFFLNALIFSRGTP